jgi:hypothetical protein
MDIQTEINNLIEAFRNETEAGENFFRLSDILEKLNRAKTDGLEEKEIVLSNTDLQGDAELAFDFAQENETLQIIGLQYKIIPGSEGLEGTIQVATANTREDRYENVAVISTDLDAVIEPETQAVHSFVHSVAEEYGKIKLEGNVVNKIGDTITITHTDGDIDNTGTFEVDEKCFCDGFTTIIVKAIILEAEPEDYTLEFDGYVPEDQMIIHQLSATFPNMAATGIWLQSNEVSGGEGMQLILKVKYTKYTW